MSFQLNDLSKKFIEEVNSLISGGMVAGYREIADKIDWNDTAISNVVNGRRNIPHQVYKRFTDTYKLENPADAGYKDKYLALLEKRGLEWDRLDGYLREVLNSFSTFQKTHELLSASLKKLSHDLRVQSAMTVAYQEQMIQHIGAGNSRKVMNQIRKRAVELLTTFELKDNGVQIGSVFADGKG